MRRVWRWYRGRSVWLQWAIGICWGLAVIGAVLPSEDDSKQRGTQAAERTAATPTATPDATATAAATVTARATAAPQRRPKPRRLSERSDQIDRVTDGDTVVLAALGRARLIGVDTPEVFGGAECYGREASSFTKQLLPPGTSVRYRLGVEKRDRYGRALVYLYKGSTFVNAELVRKGYAVPLTIAPNVRYADRFLRLSRGARASERGLWASDTCAGDPDRSASPSGGSESKSGGSSPDGGSSSGSDVSGADLSGDKDCPDFATHAEAQKYFEAKGGPASDPDRLDADHDGSACDALP
jgi:micrococcal nuclease